MEADFCAYDFWDVSQLEIPPRSHLYSPCPIAMRTAHVESFTSWVMRLAEEHCVSARTLVAEEIAPHMDVSYLDIKYLGKGFGIFTRAINGFGEISGDWVATLAALTKRTDLSLLTMLPLSGALTHKNLLRQFQAWCPLCLEEWQQDGKTLYYPLLWALNAVTYCPIHHEPLQVACSLCGCNRHFIESSSGIGYCSKCGCWEGLDPRHHDKKSYGDEDSLEQVWIAENIGSLLESAAQSSGLKPDKEKISTSLSTCINKLAGGTVSEFSRIVNINASLVRDWRLGRHVPRLDLLTRVCYYSGVSLVDFLYKNKVVVSKTYPIRKKEYQKNGPIIDNKKMGEILHNALIESPPQTVDEIAKKVGCCREALCKRFPIECAQCSELNKNFQKEHWNRIKVALDVLSETKPETTIKEIAMYLQCHVSSLYRMFPVVCGKISAKNKIARKLTLKRKEIVKANEIKKVVAMLHDTGLYPSRDAVLNHLKQGCDDSFLRRCIYQVMEEMGIVKKSF